MKSWEIYPLRYLWIRLSMWDERRRDECEEA
jgi:hypothetical protein